MLTIDRFVTAPSVAKLGSMVITSDDLDGAIGAIRREDAVETDGTPLSNQMERLLQNAFGGGDEITEFAGRQCYDSFHAGRAPEAYIDNIIESGHGSVLEHGSIAFQVAGVSRNLTHELIRHRVGTAYSQESQRYVDAKLMRFVLPPLLVKMLDGLETNDMYAHPAFVNFHDICAYALDRYEQAQDFYSTYLKGEGLTGHTLKKRVNEAARYALPSAAETKLVFTINMRALRHILTLRGGEPADLEIRRFADAMLPFARAYAPLVFADMAHRADEIGLAPVVEKLLAAG